MTAACLVRVDVDVFNLNPNVKAVYSRRCQDGKWLRKGIALLSTISAAQRGTNWNTDPIALTVHRLLAFLSFSLFLSPLFILSMAISTPPSTPRRSRIHKSNSTLFNSPRSTPLKMRSSTVINASSNNNNVSTNLKPFLALLFAALALFGPLSQAVSVQRYFGLSRDLFDIRSSLSNSSSTAKHNSDNGSTKAHHHRLADSTLNATFVSIAKNAALDSPRARWDWMKERGESKNQSRGLTPWTFSLSLDMQLGTRHLCKCSSRIRRCYLGSFCKETIHRRRPFWHSEIRCQSCRKPRFDRKIGKYKGTRFAYTSQICHWLRLISW